MQRHMSGLNYLLSVILTLTACNGFSDITISSDDSAAQSSPAIDSTQPPLELSETPTPTITPKPPAPTLPAGGKKRFQIAQRSKSDRNVMEGVALVLHSAELSADELSLRIGFENTTDQAFSIIGRFEKSNVVLIDGAGNGYEPVGISEKLQQISPAEGFMPREANVGNVIFPRPAGSEPYELRVSRFDPIQFKLDMPLPDEPSVKVPTGDYPLEVTLYSTDAALAQIELRVHSVRVEADRLMFLVGFANTSTQSYGLLTGPTGSDAWLRDIEGTRHKPIAVSQALQNGIAPKDGWKPNQEHRGNLTFLQPEIMDEVSFIFPQYSVLTILFDETGVTEVH